MKKRPNKELAAMFYCCGCKKLCYLSRDLGESIYLDAVSDGFSVRKTVMYCRSCTRQRRSKSNRVC